MTEPVNENAIENQEDKGVEAIGIDGLIILADEVRGEITFTWSEKDHPEWNFLNEVPESKLLEVICAHLDEKYGSIDKLEGGEK